MFLLVLACSAARGDTDTSVEAEHSGGFADLAGQMNLIQIVIDFGIDPL
jgi:hypothetical protein